MADKKIDEYEFEQKKINHVFHNTNRFEYLEGIIKGGFQASYCKEEMQGYKYLSPMVSFCNIPIGEVDKYARYGKNGIGMSMEWAIKNKVNPVLYIHRGSDYFNILDTRSLFKREHLDKNEDKLVKIALKLLTNIKCWKTIYKEKLINTYQEREWRYVPNLENRREILDETHDHQEYRLFTDEKEKPKQHFPEHRLNIEKISDISYIVVTKETQRKKVIERLKAKFDEESKEVVDEALINGKLSILTASQIRNDF